MKENGLPDYIFVVVAGDYEPGLAVQLRFGMKENRNIAFIVFMRGGVAIFTKEQLIAKFAQIAALATDFIHPVVINPSADFTGKIEAEALSEAEIYGAITNYHRFAKVWDFPQGYLQDLKKALKVNAKSNCLVAFEKVSKPLLDNHCHQFN